MTAVLLLGAYSVALVGIGLWIGSRVRSAQDFFVAGRRLPAGLLCATLLAANIGAGSTVGAASLGYRDGLSGWWWNGSAAIGSLLLAFWAGPRLWRLAEAHGFLTLGDFLEFRYGAAARALAAVVLWLITVFVLAAQLIGVSSILQVVAGQPRWVGAAIGGLVIVLYFVAGGMLSSVWVNLAQLVVLLGGFAAALPFALHAAMAATHSSSLLELSGAVSQAPPWLSGAKWLPLLAPAFIVSPGLVQKAFGARDVAAVRNGVAANGVALLVFAAVPPLFGLSAAVLHPALPSPDLALATVLSRDVPPVIGLLGLAAVFSAEVSSADAALFMLATSLSRDLYKRFVAPDAGDSTLVTVARISAIAGGSLGIALAIVMPTVVSALTAFYGLLTVLLFVPVAAGLHLRRGGPVEALASMLAGIAASIAVTLATNGTGVHGWRPDTIGVLVSAAAFAGVLLARRSGS